MLKNISPQRFFLLLFYLFIYLFFVELQHPPPRLLGYPSFVNTMERLSLYQLIALKKSFFVPRNP